MASQLWNLKEDKLFFPQTKTLPAYMAVPRELIGKEDVVLEIIRKYNPHPFFHHLYKSVSESIDRNVAQKRPSDLYLFAHSGADWPERSSTSYNEGNKEKLIFTDCLEYLLIALFHRWAFDKFIDINARGTNTSSFWKNGELIIGGGDRGHYPFENSFQLGFGGPEFCGTGLREIKIMPEM